MLLLISLQLRILNEILHKVTLPHIPDGEYILKIVIEFSSTFLDLLIIIIRPEEPVSAGEFGQLLLERLEGFMELL